MGALGALLGALGVLGALLGRSWGDLGRFWAALGAVLGHSGRPWATLGALGAFLGRSWGALGADVWSIWVRFGLGCFACLFIFFCCCRPFNLKKLWKTGGSWGNLGKEMDALSVPPLGQV